MPVSDERLWKLAKKRAGFKRQLVVYVIINLFLWGIWWFTAYRHGYSTGPVPWPAWVTLGWGLGIAFSYFSAYGDGDKELTIEREYEKLKREQNGDGQGQ